MPYYPPPSSGGGSVADPTALVGPTAVNGVATSAIRSDGAPALNLTANWAFVPASATSGFTIDGTTFNVDSTNHRVGLGIALPLYRLDVNTQSRLTGSSGAVGAIGGADYALSIQNNAASVWFEFLNNGGAGKGAFLGMTTGNAFEFYNYQAGPINFYTATSASGGVKRVTLANDGKFGIGLTPSYLLDVNSQARIAGTSGAVGAIGATDYALSLQNNTTSAWLEILNNGGAGKGAFFGMTSNNFEIYNYQGGPINFFTNPSASASTLRFSISKDGNVVVGSAAIATNATDGFLYIDSGAGPPTGTPTTFTGRVPIYYDSTNDQLYIYRGGWKQPKTPAGAAIVNWQ